MPLSYPSLSFSSFTKGKAKGFRKKAGSFACLNLYFRFKSAVFT
ncbi:hypothetical protein BAGQ_0918 [Bacillus velezensis]|nr:hypothetical protein BCBMB205_08430 [Bacillus velezensis]ARZ57173.1 hypothetical protein BAGQ_0918 [Bacillus velezensis]